MPGPFSWEAMRGVRCGSGTGTETPSSHILCQGQISTVPQGNAETGGFVECAGQISRSFTWTPGFVGEAKPKYAILTESCSAYYGGAADGTCDNGLGSPVVIDNNGYHVASGTRRRIIELDANGAGTITVDASANAHSVLFQEPFAAAGVEYQVVDLIPVEMSLQETYVVPDPSGPRGSNQKLLATMIGKRVKGKLTCDAYPVVTGFHCDNYLWEVEGDTFDFFTVDESAGIGTVEPIPSWTFGKQPWVWKASTAAPKLVKVTARLWFGETVIGQISAETHVTVRAPAATMFATAELWSGGPGAHFDLTINGVPRHFLLSGNWSPGHLDQPAAKFNYKMTADADLTAAMGGPGEWQYVQIANVKNTVDGVLTDDGDGLDGSFPMPEDTGGGPYPVDATPHTVFDCPGFEYQGPGGNPFSLNHSFKMYLMYRPPGETSQWTSLGYVPWTFNAGGNIPAFVMQQGVSPVAASLFVPTFAHPTWSKVHSAINPNVFLGP